MALKGFHLTKPLLLLSLLLSACSSEPAQQDESKSQSTQCSQEDISGGAAWITGQLNAFGSEDPKAAYNFASEQFRQGVSLDEFASIISGQYSALLSLKSFEIGRCFALEEGYVFQVDLIDNQNIVNFSEAKFLDTLVFGIQFSSSISCKKFGIKYEYFSNIFIESELSVSEAMSF